MNVITNNVRARIFYNYIARAQDKSPEEIIEYITEG